MHYAKKKKKSEQERKNLCQHDYHDYSMEVPNRDERGKQMRNCERRIAGVLSPGFPQKLYHILQNVQVDGYDSIISWLPHGRAFRIHKQHEFEDIILPRYFSMTKKTSFLRQLNLYGFQRISAGPDKGSYYHESFLRGMMFLTNRIIRRQINGKRVRVPSNPDAEPNFYAMRPLPLTEKFPAGKPNEKSTKANFLSKAKDEAWKKQALPLKKEAPSKQKFPLPNSALVPMLPNNVSPTKLKILSPNEGVSMKQDPPQLKKDHKSKNPSCYSQEMDTKVLLLGGQTGNTNTSCYWQQHLMKTSAASAELLKEEAESHRESLKNTGLS